LENKIHQDNGEEEDDSESGNDCDNDNNNENISDDDSTQNKTAIELYDILYVLEMLHSFHAWYKCGGPNNCGNSMEQCKIHKAKLQKFHDLLHVSRDMFMFGVHRIGLMQVKENTTLLILQNVLHVELRNNTVLL